MRIRRMLSTGVAGGLMFCLAGAGLGAPLTSAGAEPWLSLLVDPSPADYAAWRPKATRLPVARQVGSSSGIDALKVAEAEGSDVSGENDTRETAQEIAGFGTAEGANPAAQITGNFADSTTPDIDMYAVTLRAGDVLGVSSSGGANALNLFGPSGDELLGAGPGQDLSRFYPEASPLPGGGTSVFSHVAATEGRYVVAFGGSAGANGAVVQVYRPGPEVRDRTQRLFVDFDGAEIDTSIFEGSGPTTLSPLSAFLEKWGLTPADENAVIDQAMVTVKENLKLDLAGSGVKVRIRNSRDHADSFGGPNVSRVIVGGTVAESGVDTIGVAESIDPGNFEAKESALLLLDVVSANSGPSSSFNTYLKSDSDRVKFIGSTLGNLASHEAGHFLGSNHVDPSNDTLNLMDEGGNFPLLFGVGADQVGGTADDPDLDFGADIYSPNVGYSGVNDTKANTMFGLFNP
jgi:hypothetical protein